MKVSIILDKQGNSQCILDSSEHEGNIYITINEGKQELTAFISIEELRLAIKKICAK